MPTPAAEIWREKVVPQPFPSKFRLGGRLGRFVDRRAVAECTNRTVNDHDTRERTVSHHTASGRTMSDRTEHKG